MARSRAPLPRASVLRQKVDVLETDRRSSVEILLALRDLFAGSLSVVWRTCGKERCVCRRGKRHGPYFFLSIQSAGRNERYHLTEKEANRVRPAIERYLRFVRGLRRLRALDKRIEAALRRLQSLCESRSVKSFRNS
jgi:hypothetical protein